MKLLKNKYIDKLFGKPPGTLIYTGNVTEKTLNAEIFSFNESDINTHSSINVDNILNKFDNDKINWINIDTLHDVSVIQKIGEKFKIDNLILEDILNTNHMPILKIDDNYIFLSIKMFYLNQNNDFSTEHISFVLGKNFILSFQEKKGDLFNNIRQRLIENKSKARKNTTDYLLFLLVDSIIDNYFLIIDKLENKIEESEQQILKEQTDKVFQKIIDLKNQILFLRKSVSPIDSYMHSLMKCDNELINKNNLKYFDDLKYHHKNIIQDISTLKELINSNIDLYMSIQNSKLNNIMKTLTIIASIFIPLTFIAGVYGMNFDYMPELRLVWGYPSVLLLMFLIMFVMIFFFKRKKWF